MILRNCDWVDEAHEEPEKVPRKRPVTEARAAASRANGAKSRGPTSETGRSKVKFNAVQSGATCKEIIFLPGEDEGAFWAQVDRMIDEEGAQGEFEIEAIKTAANSRVTKVRAINADARPRSGIANGTAPQLSEEDIAAIREHYRQSVEISQRRINECTENGPSGPSENS